MFTIAKTSYLSLSRADDLVGVPEGATDRVIATTALSSALHGISVLSLKMEINSNRTLPVSHSLRSFVSTSPVEADQYCDLLVGESNLAFGSVAILPHISLCTATNVHRLTYAAHLPAIRAVSQRLLTGIDGASRNESGARGEGSKKAYDSHFDQKLASRKLCEIEQ